MKPIACNEGLSSNGLSLPDSLTTPKFHVTRPNRAHSRYGLQVRFPGLRFEDCFFQTNREVR
ncbi:hypothetical protein N8737_05050, partial [Verrucomicrobia bacterium]|nr:hypothetical protein [Verrucomicrobiota bacterium]